MTGAVSAALIGAACAALATIAPAGEPPRLKLDLLADAGRPATPDIRVVRTPPDPPPMVENDQWVFDLRYDRGDAYLLAVHRLSLVARQATPRAMGRFALELFEGPTLIERVRFDFPMLGAAAELDAGWGAPPSLERRLVTRIGVMFPATTRGTRLELWDRATDRRWSMPWPPQETRAAPDAGIAVTTEGGIG